MTQHGLGLTPIDDTDRKWLRENCRPMPVACSAAEFVPKSYHPKLTKRNQGRTNTCAGNAMATGLSLLNLLTTGQLVDFSALCSYLTAKQVYDGTDNDDGTSIRSLFVAAAKFGVCREATLPFRERFNGRLLTPAVRDEAKQHRVLEFIHCDGGYDQIRQLQLAGNGFFVFGGPWYEGLTVEALGHGRETEKSYVGEFLGLHARVITGWFSREEMAGYGARDDRLDLEVFNSHGDGARPISASAIDKLANDQRCEIIHCSDNDEVSPSQPADWSQLEVLL